MAEGTDGSGNRTEAMKRKQAKAEEADHENKPSLLSSKSAPFEPAWQKPLDTDPKPGSAVIVDDIILFAHTATILLFYFICMVEVLQHHRVTIKLRKMRFFPARAEFVGVDITKEGNSPAESKYEALRGLEQPMSCTDLRMLIGFIGFYPQWMPLYEDRIGRWREHLKKSPAPGEATK